MIYFRLGEDEQLLSKSKRSDVSDASVASDVTSADDAPRPASGADDAVRTSDARLRVDVTSLPAVGGSDVERFSNNSDSGEF